MSSNEDSTAVSRQPQSGEEQGVVVMSPGLQILLQILSAVGNDWHSAERVHRSELAKRYGNVGRFRDSSGNIAAIDFGTTFCSLAYTTPGDKISTVKLNEYYARVPSAILLKERELRSSATSQGAKTCSYEVVCFGYEAQEQHSKLRLRERTKHLYFERFKMTLQHDEVIIHTRTKFAHMKNYKLHSYVYVSVPYSSR